MKLKALKPHYYEGGYYQKDSVYFADKLHSDSTIRRGVCELVKETKPKPRKNASKSK